MNIVFLSDDAYADHLLISMMSVIQANHCHINFYILDTGIKDINKECFVKVLSEYNCQITFIPVSLAMYADFPRTIEHISLSTYVRLNLAEYINDDLERVIYLDVDTLVTSSLNELWEYDLKGNSIGACFDSFIEYHDCNHKYNIGLSKNEFYFNAGVLLIDLKKWKNKSVLEQSIRLISDKKYLIKYQDQDLLNIIFMNDIEFLDCRYNFMPYQLYRIKNKSLNLNIPLESTTMPIAISHFCGSEKPWGDSTHFKSDLYYSLYRKIKKHKGNFNFYNKLRSSIRWIKLKIKYNIY